MVKIIDNGIGISKEKIDNIFTLNPNNTTFGTNNEKGTGIGILLCKEFMELMNGDIIIESEIDKGTTVTLIFPN